jgi:hypothetical protein
VQLLYPIKLATYDVQLATYDVQLATYDVLLETNTPHAAYKMQHDIVAYSALCAPQLPYK